MKTRVLVWGFMALFLAASGVSFAQDETSLEMGAFAAEGSSSFLETEAGISAFTQVANVDLDLAENAFKNVEKKTTDYIIGSVALDDYPETDDVHVYVDITGWMVAYYLKEEKASKIIDWKHYTGGQITTTKLGAALGKVCAAASTSLPYIKYYDFRVPNATKMMIVVDEAEGQYGDCDTFRLMVPSTYIMYDRTWSHAMNCPNGGCGNVSGEIKIDGETLASVAFAGTDIWGIWEGDITPAQLPSEAFHEIEICYTVRYGQPSIAYVGVMLLYTEPL